MNSKVLIFCLLIFFICCDQTTSPSKSGDLQIIDGIQVLFLRGDHYNRGYQHGYLLGEKIIDVINDFIIATICSDSESLYEKARDFVVNNFTYEQKYQNEAQGMLAGILDGGCSIYNDKLKRNIDYIDILILNSIEELFNIVDKQYGCSSISSWGSSTANDSLLKGELIITRHWDYYILPALIRSLMLIVHFPNEHDEQRWVSCAWAGMIGSCSAMNENGIGAFLDYGPYFLNEDNPNISTHHPVSLSIRNGIECTDYDNNGQVTPLDVFNAIKQYVPFFGSIIHVVSSITNDSNAIMIESDNTRGVTLRTKLDNTEIPGDNLAATNHFRILYPSTECWRYKNITDSLKISLYISSDRSWNLLAGAAPAKSCLISVSYVPAFGSIRCSFATVGDTIPAYDLPSTIVSMNTLFDF